MPTAKKLPSGQWRTLAYGGKDSNGQRHYKSFTSESKKESEYLAAEYELKHKKPNSKEKLTFQVAADQYIEMKENILSPSTIRGYKAMLKKDYPMLLNIQVGKLDTDDTIQKQMNQNAKTHSAKSLYNQYNFITAVMRSCNFQLGKGDVTLKPREKHSIPVPTKKESAKIIEILNQDPKIQCQILLAITCSLRLSEICDLKVSNVEGDYIHVHGATVRGVKGLEHKETNKSAAGTRTVHMPPALSKLVEKRCEEIEEGKLFPLHPSNVLERFQKLLVKNGLPKYTVQSMRHCFAATLHSLGVPDKYIMKMGGWETDSVMKNIYQYAFEDEADKVEDQANKYFDSVMNKPKSLNNATRNATQSEKNTDK